MISIETYKKKTLRYYFYLLLLFRRIRSLPKNPVRCEKNAPYDQNILFTIATLPSLNQTCKIFDTVLRENPSWAAKIILLDQYQSAKSIQLSSELIIKGYHDVISIFKIFQETGITFESLISSEKSELDPLLIEVCVLYLFNNGFGKVLFLDTHIETRKNPIKFDNDEVTNTTEKTIIKKGFSAPGKEWSEKVHIDSMHETYSHESLTVWNKNCSSLLDLLLITTVWKISPFIHLKNILYNLRTIIQIIAQLLRDIIAEGCVKHAFFSPIFRITQIHKESQSINHLISKENTLKNLFHPISSAIISQHQKTQSTQFGITLYGYFEQIFGIADIGRSMAHTLVNSQVPLSLYPIKTAHHQIIKTNPLSTYWKTNYFSTQKSYQYNIFMVNADLIPRTITSLPPGFLNDKYTIGCWFWEIEDYFPFEEAFDYIDEIWGFSDFCCNIFQKYSQKPVNKITYPFYKTWNTITEPSVIRTSLGIQKNSIVFFFNFDFHSGFERKNPLGIIRAFTHAFMNGTENVRLIIKTIHARKYIDDAQCLYEAIKHDKRIIWIDKPMTKDQVISLMNASDCYISLHRSEGLGMGLIEAMYLGKCVIATAYGGNLDFMNQNNSLLIDYSYTEVKKPFGPYKKGCKWAEPRLDQAIHVLKNTYLHYEELQSTIGNNASNDITTIYDPKKTTDDILQRICSIDNKLNRY